VGLNRRHFLIASLTGLGVTLPMTAWAHQVVLPDKFLPQLVNTRQQMWEAGEIHVIPDDYFLYFMLHSGLAIRYGVGVGRDGLYEAGTFTVRRKAEWPWWRPTNAMIRRDPEKYARFADGVPGGPQNPLGARALYLYDELGRDTYLRIHGTNAPSTIGSAVSNGCARLTNDHIIDLFPRVDVGAKVVLHPKSPST
jgi:lipoprotein-anchoring transpeptidase ErfK/SrfK